MCWESCWDKLCVLLLLNELNPGRLGVGSAGKSMFYVVLCFFLNKLKRCYMGHLGLLVALLDPEGSLFSTFSRLPLFIYLNNKVIHLFGRYPETGSHWNIRRLIRVLLSPVAIIITLLARIWDQKLGHLAPGTCCWIVSPPPPPFYPEPWKVIIIQTTNELFRAAARLLLVCTLLMFSGYLST